MKNVFGHIFIRFNRFIVTHLQISGEFIYITGESGDNGIVYHSTHSNLQLYKWILHLFAHESLWVDWHI